MLEFNKLTAENFTTRLKQANLANKADIADFVEKSNFDAKFKKSKKKATSNKKNYAEAEKKLTDLINKVKQSYKEGYAFLLGRLYFTSNDGYQNFLSFPLMLSSIISDIRQQ